MGFDFSEGTMSYQKEQLALCNIIYIEKTQMCSIQMRLNHKVSLGNKNKHKFT